MDSLLSQGVREAEAGILFSGLTVSGCLSGLIPKRAKEQAMPLPTVPALKQRQKNDVSPPPSTVPTRSCSDHGPVETPDSNTQITLMFRGFMLIIEQHGLKLF